MNFIERNKTKLVILLTVIPLLLFYMFPKTIAYIFSDLTTFSFYILISLPVILYVIYELYLEKKRAIDLKVYSEKHNYDFYENPNEDQISIFNKFKSIRTINNQDKFFNLLVPKDDNQTKPLIVTGKSVFGGGQYTRTYNTQIFLYKSNAELPKFYIQRKNTLDTMLGERREHIASQQSGIELYKFKKKEFPHNRYFFFSEDPNIENFITDDFIEILKTGIIRKKALINIESNGQNLIFYKQWSRHSLELMDYYSNLFKAIKESLIR